MGQEREREGNEPVGGVGEGVEAFGSVDGDEDDVGCWVGEEVGGCGWWLRGELWL